MGTPYQIVYDAFLAKIKEDDWSCEADFDAILEDWRAILESALPFFKYPKLSLAHDDNGFLEELSNDEIQIIANLMKAEWLARTIATWENVKVMYDERDFSQANLLDKFIKLQEQVQQKNRKLQKIYYRTSVKNGVKKSYPYGNFAGGVYND